MYPSGKAWLFAYFKKYRGQFVAGTLFVLISVSLGVVMPRYVGYAIDYLRQPAATKRGLLHYVSLIVGSQLLSGVFLFLQRRTLINMSRHIEYDLRQDFYAHLQTLPLQFFQTHRIGDLMARATNDLGAVRMLAGPAIMYSEQTLFRVLLVLPIMFTISAKLTFILLLTMPLVSVTVKYFGQRIHTQFEKVQEFFAEITARAQENLTGVRVVRAYAQEEAEQREFARLNEEYVARNLRLVKLSAVFRPLMMFTIGLAQVVILWYGGREAARGAMSVGEFTSFFLYLEQLIWPLIAMGYVTNMVQRGTASLNRMQQVMATIPAIRDETATVKPSEPIKGKIEFRHLTFHYAPEEMTEKATEEATDAPAVLRDINLVIEPGQTVAFIGRTGAGKSTLLNLVPRLLDAAPGMVFVDDHPIREIPLQTLRAAIGYVPQETFLFSETLRENIRFGVTATGAITVEQAATIASLAADVEAFPLQYETVLGERGITLSGGQKQRTAIARAVLREPTILLLDDALSAVDTYTEEKILSQLRGVRHGMGHGRTTLIVAHRISTVKDADLICVLEQGRIVERGTHEELLAHGGAYAELHQRQLLEEELAAVS